MDTSMWIAVLGGIGIAAACGLRAFLPLFVLGLVARLGAVDLDPRAAWMSSNVALIAFGVATVLEVAGDKFPLVDHFLDVVGTVLRPAAGWLGARALFEGWPDPGGAIAALAFASLALGVHAIKANLRLGSTAMTAGAGNPLVSILEDFAALLISLLAILLPLLGFALLLLGALWLARRRPPAHG